MARRALCAEHRGRVPSAVHTARLRAQLLAGAPARDAVAVAERLLAIQGQDPRGLRLAVRARSRVRSAADIDRALSTDRSLLITWLNRGTLHLVRREDYPWLHALTAPSQMTGNARRLAQLGLTPGDADRGVLAIERALGADGPLTRAQLSECVAAASVPTAGQALVHVLMLASLRGLIVRGPMAGRQHAYVLVRDWLGPTKPVERDAALAELARRYLNGHGPAGARDLARWAGLGLRDARAGLSAIATELRECGGDLVDVARAGVRHATAPPRLLGSFEPVLLGWTSRAALLAEHEPAVAVGGLFRPFALVGGRGSALWRLSGSALELEPFVALEAGEVAALRRDASEVARFLAAA